MQGRWAILKFGSIEHVSGPETPSQPGGQPWVPVVPCDDLAIGRAVGAYERELEAWGGWDDPPARKIVEAILRAAGETP